MPLLPFEARLKPKVFISYSWSSPGHQTRVRQWAEQLLNDGVDVVLDIWDLKEGDDKYAFMENMITDESVTHVLVFSDSGYTEKADARKAGVGTESQIISKEVYSKIKQSKFLPIVCEFDTHGKECLPTFFQSRIWIDFSSDEAVNKNWEQLIRVLFGKPAYEKPQLGSAPVYITTDTATPASPSGAKFAALKQAVAQNKRDLKSYRQDYLDACCNYADMLRIRERPDISNFGQRVLEDCSKLKIVRDQIADWVLLESGNDPSEDFIEALVTLLERLLELKSRPPEIQSWNDTWFDAHRVFAYETFLYIVAALLKTDSFYALHNILTCHYMLPETRNSSADQFGSFDVFYGYSDALQILAPSGRTLEAPAAEFIKRQADHAKLPFSDIMQADLLVLMLASITEHGWWYPQTLHHLSRANAFPFFLKAARHRDFQKLAKITGVASGEKLREAVRAGQERLKVNQWNGFWRLSRSLWSCMNMDALDTLS